MKGEVLFEWLFCFLSCVAANGNTFKIRRLLLKTVMEQIRALNTMKVHRNYYLLKETSSTENG